MSAGDREDFWRNIRQRGQVLLTGPVAPDADSIGACLALQHALSAHNVVAVVTGEIPERYQWVPGIENVIPEGSLSGHWDAVVILDGDRHRLTPKVEEIFAKSPYKAIIDHHASTTFDGYDGGWVDEKPSSACEMLYQAFCHWNVPIDIKVATWLYSGLVFDTGGFRYSNAGQEVHHVAASLLDHGIDHATISARVLYQRSVAGFRAAGFVAAEAEFLMNGRLLVSAITQNVSQQLALKPGDLEGIVDNLVFVEGVEVACLAIAQNGAYKLSLRSRNSVNVCEIAKNLAPGGGGHAKAAGATGFWSVPEIKQLLIQEIARQLAD